MCEAAGAGANEVSIIEFYPANFSVLKSLYSFYGAEVTSTRGYVAQYAQQQPFQEIKSRLILKNIIHDQPCVAWVKAVKR